MVHFCHSLPCTTIRHTRRMFPAATFCYGTKTKRSCISLIYRIVCFELRNLAQQKRSFEKDLVSGKRKLNLSFLSVMYQYVPAKFRYLGHYLVVSALRRNAPLCYDTKIRFIILNTKYNLIS